MATATFVGTADNQGMSNRSVRSSLNGELKSNFEDKENAESSYALDLDVYNSFLMSVAHDRMVARQIGVFARIDLVLFPLLLSILSGGMQYILARTLLVHVQTNMIQSFNGKVNLALFHKISVNKTLDGDDADDICGKFDYLQLEKGPGSSVVWPDGSDAPKGIASWNKFPFWRWDANWMGEDKSIIDRIRFVASERFHYFDQGYAYLFMLVNILWLSSIVVELRSITRMALMLVAMPTKGSDADCILSYNVEENKYQLNEIPTGIKGLGFLIVIMRFFLGLVIGWAGVAFLRFTDTMVDLLLNSLALVFILELDSVLFKTMLARTQQNLVEELEPISYRSQLPKCMRTFLRYFFPVVGLGVVIIATAYVRQAQLQLYDGYFDNAAQACLFLGDADGGYFAPVPGFCESLLKLTCREPVPGKVDNNPCVVTDYDIPWTKNVHKGGEKSVYPHDIFIKGDATSVWDWRRNEETPAQAKFQLVDADGGLYVDNGSPLPFMHGVHAMQRACLAMYQKGPLTKTDAGYLAPFRCKMDSPMGTKFFKSFTYQYETDPITYRVKDVTPSNLPLLSGDRELGESLQACGR